MGFKIGDKVKRTKSDNKPFMVGDIHPVTRVECEFVYVEIDGYEVCSSNDNVELAKGRGRPKKEKVDSGIRFMAMESACQNKSELFKEELELKVYMEGISNPDGEHIGYKLIPLFKSENKKVFTKIKVAKK